MKLKVVYIWLAACSLSSDADFIPMIIQQEPFLLENYSFLVEHLKSITLLIFMPPKTNVLPDFKALAVRIFVVIGLTCICEHFQ
jgi:hypothetical protein